MSQVSKISVALTPELSNLVGEAVEIGDYASVSEVIREALREWKRRRGDAPADIERLRRLWTDGVGSGPGRFEDMAAIKAEARRRLRDDTPTTSG